MKRIFGEGDRFVRKIEIELHVEIIDRNGLNTWLAVLNRQFRLNLPEAEEKRMKNEYREEQRDPEAEDPNEGTI